MIWILTATYFVIYLAPLWLGFWLYGKALTHLGKTGVIMKNFGGFVIYVIFACLLVSPLFLAPNFIENWRDEVKSNLFYMMYFVLCYLLSLLPGGVYFKKHCLRELKDLGYFTNK